MNILAIRTDKPEAELYAYKDKVELGQLKWQAHLKLSGTIHQKIEEILNKSSISLSELGGIVVFEGPGSFTGLRIGITVANALAYAQAIPVVACAGDDWLNEGIDRLASGNNDKIAKPEYGAPPHITQPRK
ncbi:tRNA (adenosine(37)-N6)-threonylcarbamoyltransferase complex dimerization subunit type 1 TsaB [Candidatus Saccharibacteria bacterium]|nr:tRNA (adenosine(37)-N6)-threonylcarbamoyltransferase complex dimerization subunit type 1 TsaB [Candidatus Saccharibacteria bacterium]